MIFENFSPIKNIRRITIEWMAPPSNDVHPSHHRTYGSRIRRFATHLSNRALHQSELFRTLRNRLQMFLGFGHPLSENQCSCSNFRKNRVQSFPTRESFAVCRTSFPMGTMTSADFSTMPIRGYGGYSELALALALTVDGKTPFKGKRQFVKFRHFTKGRF